MTLHSDLDKIIFLETVDSTNQELKRRRSEFSGSNVLLISEEQTSGQGQQGRKWESAAGLGLWMSLFLSRELSLAHDLHLLSLYAGVILQKTMAEQVGSHVSLKWPNDLMIGPKKCGGILTEIQWQGNQPASIILGVGVNLRHQLEDFPTALQDVATSLLLEGSSHPDRTSIMQSFITNFFKNMTLLNTGEALAEAWNRHAYNPQGGFFWQIKDRRVEGEFLGVNSAGEAQVVIDNQLQCFRSGEIRLKERG